MVQTAVEPQSRNGHSRPSVESEEKRHNVQMREEAYERYERAAKMLVVSKLDAMDLAMDLLLDEAEATEVETAKQRRRRVVDRARQRREMARQYEAQQQGGEQ